MWNVGPNSLEIFIKIILDNWVRTLRNQVRIRSHKIRSECPQILSKIQTFGQPGLDIGYSDLGQGLAEVFDL